MKSCQSHRKATQGAIVFALFFYASGLVIAEETKDTLAQIGDHIITEADIADDIAGQMVRINNQLYTIKKQAVDSAVADYLIDQEAKKRGMTREQLLQQEITNKTQPVTDVEIQQVYEANKTRLGGKKLEEIKPQIQQQLQANKHQQRQQEFAQELRKEASVKMFLKPPVLEVSTDGAPTRGPANAPITIVEFSDFQCPYCVRVQPALEKVREIYKDKVKIVYKDFPLSIHNNAQKAAEAARCILEQDREKYWEYHDMLFSKSSALGEDDLKKYAADLKFDTAKFNKCLDSGKYAAAVSKDMADGMKVGVSGTPAFLINGRFLSGAQPFNAFQEVIEEELSSN
ncbi:MAG: thioredoxin domain-containing protein [Candidatus Binatia bacterium]